MAFSSFHQSDTNCSSVLNVRENNTVKKAKWQIKMIMSSATACSNNCIIIIREKTTALLRDQTAGATRERERIRDRGTSKNNYSVSHQVLFCNRRRLLRFHKLTILGSNILDIQAKGQKIQNKKLFGCLNLVNSITHWQNDNTTEK